MEINRTTFTIKRLWWLFAASMVVMFGTLLYFGREIYHQAPPIPVHFETTSGEVVYTRADIERGQNVWQSTGGMQQGALWGHGGYLAPDWSADWLHREAETLLVSMIANQDSPTAASEDQKQEMAKVMLRLEMRKNTFDPKTEVVTITPARALCPTAT